MRDKAGLTILSESDGPEGGGEDTTGFLSVITRRSLG